jgi:hypothetical protein
VKNKSTAIWNTKLADNLPGAVQCAIKETETQGCFNKPIGLVLVMGIAGILVAAVTVAALLGVVVSALHGAEIKRAFLIGGLFMTGHIAVGVGLHLMT